LKVVADNGRIAVVFFELGAPVMVTNALFQFVFCREIHVLNLALTLTEFFQFCPFGGQPVVKALLNRDTLIMSTKSKAKIKFQTFCFRHGRNSGEPTSPLGLYR